MTLCQMAGRSGRGEFLSVGRGGGEEGAGGEGSLSVVRKREWSGGEGGGSGHAI